MSDLKIFAEEVEDQAIDQIKRLISLKPFENCKIRIMPDVHAGAGCVVGFTADLGDKVIPNLIGVDIGCGIMTCELGNIDIDYAQLDRVIREFIPSGFNVHNEEKYFARSMVDQLYCKEDLKNKDHIYRSLGTLGGGNHFIEIDQDEEGCKYLVIHTGSRNLGTQVCDIYQRRAIGTLVGKDKMKKQMNQLIKDYKQQGREDELEEAIEKFKKDWENNTPEVPKDLCWLEGEWRKKYLHDMQICQEFANFNRDEIRSTICQKMEWYGNITIFDTVHNYIDFEDNIARKGSISAKNGKRVIIPMNMRDGCIIGIGKGNEDWNCSAPHGAGRKMSRTAAKNNLTMDEYEESMKGIFTTSVDESTIDEAPMAYKSMDMIVSIVEATIDIEKIIKPVYNFKAAEEDHDWKAKKKKKKKK